MAPRWMLLLAALLLAACGRAEPSARATPTAVSAGQAPTLSAPEIAALPSATPAGAPPEAPSPAAATTAAALPTGASPTPAAPAQADVPEPVSPGAAFDRLRYLLPPDARSYSVVDPGAAAASERGFGVGLVLAGREPGPRVTVIISGGENAWPEWQLHRSPNNPTTPVSVRGAHGTLIDDGLAEYLVWEEEGNVYAVAAPYGSVDDIIAFADALAGHDRVAWEGLVGRPPTGPAAYGGLLRYLAPPDLAGYQITSGPQETVADELGFYVELTPNGFQPDPFTVITIAGGAPAAPVWEANKPSAEPGALIEEIAVRGVRGTLTSSGLGAALAWVEAGQPYYVSHPGPDAETILAFVEALEEHDLASWRAAVLAPR